MTQNVSKYWSSGAVPLLDPAIMSELISAASDIAIVISDVGKIHSVLVNPAHPSFGAIDHWEERDIRAFLTVESVPKLVSALDRLNAGEPAGRAIELNHTDNVNWDFPVRYTLHKIGHDGDVVMMGRDLRPIAEMQQQLIKAQLALERDYEAHREFDTRYRLMMEETREGMVFVGMNSGRIADLNSAAAELFGGQRDDMVGSAFAQEFDGRRRSELLDTLMNKAIANSTSPLELQTRRSEKTVLVTPTVFRAAGERMLLCRVETPGDGEPVSDALTENLVGLYHEGPEAIVFTDKSGEILSANEAFLDLADAAHISHVKGKSLADYLSRGSVDLNALVENAARTGRMRMYATKFSGELGGQLSVEVSATYLNDRANPSVVFVIRNASRADNLRPAGKSVSGDNMKSVMELVGNASLKEIVAETADVVEKMCIETAVELTRNNRVAAAEMLGLSRQSLYVKLRKYGLLNKDGD